MMGVYPPGSVVQLTDDRYALVVCVNSTRPLKPRVLVHDPQVPRDEALLAGPEDTPDLGIRRSLKPAQLPPDGAGLPVAAPARGLLLRAGAQSVATTRRVALRAAAMSAHRRTRAQAP